MTIDLTSAELKLIREALSSVIIVYDRPDIDYTTKLKLITPCRELIEKLK